MRTIEYDDIVKNEKYKLALNLVLERHKDQKYGEEPYVSGHLIPVSKIAYSVKPTLEVAIIGLLHDILEDTETTYEEVSKLFGHDVAKGVYAVTDFSGRFRKIRKLYTYHAIRTNEDALVVKLSDRFHNVSSGGKLDMYRKEHYVFRAALWTNSYLLENIWQDLENMLFPDDDTYIKYMC